MQRLEIHRRSTRMKIGQAGHRPLAWLRVGEDGKCWLPFLLSGLIVLSACGGGSSSPSQSAGSIAGNWQFVMTPPADNSFQGGMQGGFLLQSKSTVTGGVPYSVALPAQQQGGTSTLCSSGSAPVTGTIDGQTVTHRSDPRQLPQLAEPRSQESGFPGFRNPNPRREHRSQQRDRYRHTEL